MVKGIDTIKMNLALSQKTICLKIKTDELLFSYYIFRSNLLYYSLVYL